MDTNIITYSDALQYIKIIPDNSIDCIVTSPPYYKQRDYGIENQIGQEQSVSKYIFNLSRLFLYIKPKLKDTATVWVNLGDTYINNSLCLVPQNFMLELQGLGYLIRSDIIWNKTNAMPKSNKNRPILTHEYIIFVSKTASYYFNEAAIREPLSPNSDVAYRAKLRENKKYNSKEPYKNNFPKTFNLESRKGRSVWNIPTKPSKHGHIAPMPLELVRKCLLAGCPENGLVFDPFMGSGTTALVAKELNINYIGCDLNEEYVNYANERLYNANTKR